MGEVLTHINAFITADYIALLSVIITILIFIVSRHIEIRYKKHDDKKIQYLKLINLMQKSLSNYQKNKEGTAVLTGEMNRQFFDTGASLLLYGSKKIYRQYLLFREFATNPLIKQCKYYKDSMIIYIMGDILRTMRKEVGLSYFNSIRKNEALAFFVNDIACNPCAKKNDMDAGFRMKMIRFELAMIDRTQFIFVRQIYTDFIRPVFAGISIIMKYLVIIPVGYLLKKLFPKFFDRRQKNIQLPK